MEFRKKAGQQVTIGCGSWPDKHTDQQPVYTWASAFVLLALYDPFSPSQDKPFLPLPLVLSLHQPKDILYNPDDLNVREDSDLLHGTISSPRGWSYPGTGLL